MLSRSISGRVGAVWALNGPPIVDSIAFFGSDDGYMYVSPAHWRYFLIKHSPFSSRHFLVPRYAIHIGTGDVLWEFGTGGQVEAAAAVSDGVVYVDFVDGDSEQFCWPKIFETVFRVPRYFGSLDYNVYAVNASNGVGLWKYKTGLYVSSVPAVQDGIA